MQHMIFQMTLLTLLTLTAVAEGVDEAAARVEQYLNDIRSMEASFSQYAAGEAYVAEGAFYYQQPGKFLWQYVTPDPQKLVSTGSQLFYQDEATGQVTQLPLSFGLGQLLTQDKLGLHHAGLTTADWVLGPDYYEVTVKLLDEEDTPMNQVRLVFDKQPVQLRQIITTDQLGVRTMVALSDVSHNVELDTALFEFTPPQYENEQFRD